MSGASEQCLRAQGGAVDLTEGTPVTPAQNPFKKTKNLTVKSGSINATARNNKFAPRSQDPLLLLLLLLFFLSLQILWRCPLSLLNGGERRKGSKVLLSFSDIHHQVDNLSQENLLRLSLRHF